MRRATHGLVIALVMVAFTSCGGATHELDPDAAQMLGAEVAAARDATTQRDFVRAATLLRAVEDTVHGLRAQGRIDDRRAAEILAAAGEAQDRLRRYAEGG